MSSLKKRIIKAIDAYLKAEKAMFSSSKWKIFSLAWLIIAIVFFGWNLSLISDGISLRAAAESQQVIEENDSYEKIEDTTQSQSDDSVQLEINNQVTPTGTVTSDSEADFVAKADQANNLSRSVPTGDSHKLFFDIRCVENWFFNKDDIKILIDGENVGFVPHGWECTGFVNLSEGEHEIKLASSSNYTKRIAIDQDATFSCAVTVDFSELDISDYSFVYGIKTNSDVFYALPGTYYGSNGSGLILFNDYTAERYSTSLGDEIVNDCYWYYKDDQFVLKLSNPSATVYANISVDNAESMLLQSKSSSWTTEEYIKISDETVSLSTGEYRDLIVNGQKQAEISKAITSIDNIGIVDKNSGDGIKHARSLYDALDSDGKEQVSNIEVLEAAEASYSAIMITEIENAIESIGEVTLDSESTISTARKLYDHVDAQTQKSISNYDILTQAEENLSQLKVEHVTESIAAINVDKLTLDDESTVKSVQAEFNKLTNDEKAQVENSQVISDANGRLAELKKEEQERLEAEKEKELNNALAKLQKEEDKVTGITYYKPSNYPKYLNNKSYALPYLGVKGDDVQVLISMDYYGDSWIFWHTVTFAVDDYRWSKKYYDVSRDVDNGGDVVEFKSITCGTEEITMLSKIADSDETIIRFQGDDYKKDITFSASDKKAVGELMEAYRLLKAR